MLPGNPIAEGLTSTPLAYIFYDAEDRLAAFNQRAADLLPLFQRTDLIGKTRKEIVALLIESDPVTMKSLLEIGKVRSRHKKDGSMSLGVFHLGDGRVCSVDDIEFPTGVSVTIMRDLSTRNRMHENVQRFEKAVSQLANEQAIYGGQKEEAYRIMTRVACEALEAVRTGVWLMNVDGTTLYPQESYWRPDGDYVDLDPVEAKTQQPLFLKLIAGEPINAHDVSIETCVTPLIQNEAHQQAIKSMLVVPIRRGPRTVGAIVVSEAENYRVWMPNEIAFISYLCDLVLRMLEAHDRQVAEEGLRGFNEMLELRVKNRTQELEQAMETIKLAQEELVRSEKMASLGGLVAGVAHEINTPLGVSLTSMSHLAEALAAFKQAVVSGRIRKSDLSDFVETADETTKVVLRNLDRAAHLVRSFKMVAVDQSADDMRRINIGDYIHETVDSLNPTLRKKGVRVDASANGDLVLETVPGDLSHILTNLIMNAALHAFAGSLEEKEKKITVSAKRLTGKVRLSVSDNGCGIPADIRDKIFEPFFTTARAAGGSGLGLNIVYNTVYQKLKGSIDVKDVKGGGTCFVVDLPV